MTNRTAHKYANQRDQAEIERNEMARTLARLREDIGMAHELLGPWGGSAAGLIPAIHNLIGERNDIHKERDEARRLSSYVLCSYCGHQTEKAETEDATADLMVEHIAACPAHPFAKAEALVAALLSALKAMVVQWVGEMQEKERADFLRDYPDSAIAQAFAAIALAEPAPPEEVLMNHTRTTEHREAMVEHLSSQINAELAKPAAPIVPEPGLHKDMPYDVYTRWDAINHSILKLYARSPLHAHEEMLHPKEPTPAMEFGQAAHLAILEPERFETEVLVPENAPRERRSKADKQWWVDFEKEHRGATILKREAFDSLKAMKDAVWSHPACRKFISAPGLNEASFAWIDPRTGLLCKAREDMLREVDGYAWALNLKSTKNAALSAFARDVLYLQYHEAAAYYLDGMKALGQDDVRFAFLAIEKERPFGCAVWELDDASIALGRAKVREHLATHKACVDANDWPGYSRECDYLSVPAYALKGFNDGD